MSGSRGATARRGVLAGAEWAAEHLEDPEVRFIELSRDTLVYDGIHIPGAIRWDWMTQLSHRVRRDIPSPEALSALASGSGIGPDTHVVLYGDDRSWFAAWGYWLLALHHHERLSLLDGGRKTWTDSHLPVLVSVIEHEPTAITLPEPDLGTRATAGDILGRLDDERLVIVDSRPPDEHDGSIVAPPELRSEAAQRAGRIPGSVSVPWDVTVGDDGLLRHPDALRAIYAAVGVEPERDIVVYGRIGERAAHSWFVLHEVLGFPSVRLYDGGWVEWGSLIGVPIENASADA